MGRAAGRLQSRIISAIDFAPVADGDDEDLQNAVMDFVNHPVIADTNPPGVAAFEFFHVGRARVGLQSGQSRQNPVRNFIRQPVQFLLNRLGQDDLKFHFALRLRLAR